MTRWIWYPALESTLAWTSVKLLCTEMADLALKGTGRGLVGWVSHTWVHSETTILESRIECRHLLKCEGVSYHLRKYRRHSPNDAFLLTIVNTYKLFTVSLGHAVVGLSEKQRPGRMIFFSCTPVSRLASSRYCLAAWVQLMILLGADSVGYQRGSDDTRRHTSISDTLLFQYRPPS